MEFNLLLLATGLAHREALQECDVKDTVIAAGESFTVRNPGLTLLTALSASELTIIEPRAAAQPQPWHPAPSREQQRDDAVFA